MAYYESERQRWHGRWRRGQASDCSTDRTSALLAPGDNRICIADRPGYRTAGADRVKVREICFAGSDGDLGGIVIHGLEDEVDGWLKAVRNDTVEVVDKGCRKLVSKRAHACRGEKIKGD